MLKLRENYPIPGDEMGGDSGGGYEIEFQGVSFGYPERGDRLFEGLNLKIGKGQFAAIVGASGCGKSTLISILERSISPAVGGEWANWDVKILRYRCWQNPYRRERYHKFRYRKLS